MMTVWSVEDAPEDTLPDWPLQLKERFSVITERKPNLISYISPKIPIHTSDNYWRNERGTESQDYYITVDEEVKLSHVSEVLKPEALNDTTGRLLTVS